MMDRYGSMIGWGWMWIFWALIVIGAVLLGIVLINLLRGRGSRPEADSNRHDSAASTMTARQILEQRYARGEIDTAEYRERLENLNEGP